MAEKILLQRSQIDGAVASLTALAESVDSKKLNVDFGKSSGAFTEATVQYADELKRLGKALSSLYYNTAVALTRIAEEFYGNDETVASAVAKGGNHALGGGGGGSR